MNCRTKFSTFRTCTNIFLKKISKNNPVLTTVTYYLMCTELYYLPNLNG